jgi:hypothetical protein
MSHSSPPMDQTGQGDWEAYRAVGYGCYGEEELLPDQHCGLVELVIVESSYSEDVMFVGSVIHITIGTNLHQIVNAVVVLALPNCYDGEECIESY